MKNHEHSSNIGKRSSIDDSGSIVDSANPGTSYRYDCNGWNYVHVEGDAKFRGRAYGNLMAEEIAAALEEAKRLIVLQTGLEWDFFRGSEKSIIGIWEKHISSEPYLEFREELTDYWFPTVDGDIYNSIKGPVQQIYRHRFLYGWGLWDCAGHRMPFYHADTAGFPS